MFEKETKEVFLYCCCSLFHLVWPTVITTLLWPSHCRQMANKLENFVINADTLILTIIKGVFLEHSSLMWHIPIPHFWGVVSVFSWQILSRTAFPFNAVLKPSAVQFVCFRQAALDDVSFEKNPSGQLLHTVSLSGVPVEIGKQCIQLYITSTVKNTKKPNKTKNKKTKKIFLSKFSCFCFSYFWSMKELPLGKKNLLIFKNKRGAL